MDKHIIYFVRHGESLGNVKRMVLGPKDDMLTEKGQNQAELLGAHLKDVKFTRVISSDFPRCEDTTKIVMSKSGNPSPIKTDPRLQEINFGIFEGKTYRECLIEMSKVSVPIHLWEIPEGETHEQLIARFDSFFKEYMTEFDQTKEPQTVLFCSHAFFLRRIALCLNSSDYIELENWDESCNKLMRNTSYMKVQVDRLSSPDKKRKVKFLSVHTAEHLPAPVSDPTAKFPDSVTAATGQRYQDCIQS